MSWTIVYHPGVVEDLDRIGRTAARRVVRAIDAKMAIEPLSFGAPLSGNLANLRKLRVGAYRVVYQVRHEQIIVLVLTVGPRRDMEVYQTALKRL